MIGLRDSELFFVVPCGSLQFCTAAVAVAAGR